MAKLITVYNSGFAIDSAVVDGFQFSIGDNQCKDFEESIATKILKEFPQLEVQGRTEVVVENTVGDNEPKPGSKEEFEASLRKGEKFFCSICDREFKNNAGYRNHLKTHE